jgi:predicted nucleic acid-binding protein
MARIYLDSAPLIYLVENVAPYAATLVTRLSAPNTIQVCSELTRLECRVKPIRDGETALVAAFDSYFANIITTVLPLSRQTIDQATELRARYGFKTPDAIHLASAITAGCDLFLTNDHRLDKCAEITIETVQP